MVPTVTVTVVLLLLKCIVDKSVVACCHSLFNGCSISPVNISFPSSFSINLIPTTQSPTEMDESITQRMNRIRDTLMDAMLEKQNETNSAVRNVTVRVCTVIIPSHAR